MRFLHTADWHLGRTLHGADLIEDQAHLLNQVVALAKDSHPDVVLIAGDIYDRAVPPPEAVALLDDILSRLIVDLRTRVIIIAGNHDSPSRLAFGSRVFMDRGLHILGQPISSTVPVVLGDEDGPVHFYPLPYAEPAIVRHCLSRDDLQGHQQAMRCLLEGLWARHPRGVRSVAVAHCFVTGSTETESERPLSVGGAGVIEPAVFEGFDYVALGHLHRPQAPDARRIRYSGSLMRYSFSEVDHDKAVLLVEMDAHGSAGMEEIHLKPRRQVRCLRGELTQIITGAKDDPAPQDYLMVYLLDQGPVFDAMGRLREVYPNALHIERQAVTMQAEADAKRVDHRRMGDLELFGTFFKQVTREDLSQAQMDAFIKTSDGVRQIEREAQA